MKSEKSDNATTLHLSKGGMRLVLCGLLMLACLQPAMAYDTLWVSGYSLMPGTRGYWPNPGNYGGTVPLDPNGGAWASGAGTHSAGERP